MKKFLTIIILCIGLSIIGEAGLCREVKAKEYNIESAEFNVNLDENGNAEINERWNINFTKGDFTEFKVSRLVNPNELEKVNDIKFERFKINNKYCSETNDINGKPEETYSITRDEDLLEYAWYFKANNEKLTLESNYKLNNLVKYTDNEKALFCYRFIGKKFEKDIDNLNITVKLPWSGNIEVRNDSGMKYEIFEDKIQLSKLNSSGMVKVNLALDKNIFSNNLEYISQKTINEIYKSEKSSEEFIEFFFMGIAAIVFTLIIWRAYVYFKKVRFAKNETFVKESISKLKNDDITPYEFSRLCKVQRVYFNEFKLIFLDFIRRDILTLIDDKIYINNDMKSSLKYFETKVFDFLFKYKSSDSEGRSYITKDGLLNIMKDNDKVIDLMYKCNSSRIDEYRKDNKKIIDVLKVYYKSYALGYTNDMEEVINKYINDNFIELENLYYMASRVDTTSEKDSSGYEDNVWSYMTFSSLHYVDNSSSSSGSGCTSCSSCSSCGGGGAS